MDGQAVAEDERLALHQVREDVAFVDRRLLMSGRPTMMTSARRTALGGRVDLEAGLLGDLLRLGAGIEADDDLANRSASG